MRILICDDDLFITEQLKKYLLEYFKRSSLRPPEITIFFSGESLLADTGDKDIIFLDVEMPGVSGIYTGQELKSKYPNIIIFIVTSFAEYLDEAMSFHVFRYLSKPIDKQRLFRNLKDALRLYLSNNTKIAIETKTSVHSANTSNLICVETQGRKTLLHTTNATYESIQPMTYWIKALDIPCFFQTHRSFIVNLEHVTDFDHTMIFLYKHQFSAYLTRRKYSSFKAAYLLYLESIQ